MKKIVALTGAGVSAESGLQTFRDADGLWEGYDVMDVATFEAWQKNQELVLDFYNMRRKQALEAKPNAGHFVLAELEANFEVTIITQNVDNLHEKAGSSDVRHLHGELFKSRSTTDETLVYDIEGWELKQGDLCEKGNQLRPHIVWFGEAVPMMDEAVEVVSQADYLIIAGTSLVVYPAAGLINFAPNAEKFLVDPNIPEIAKNKGIHLLEEPATTGLKKVKEILLKDRKF